MPSVMQSTTKRNFALISLLIAAIGLTSAPAKSKKHFSLPEEFESAHTVFIESRDGDITDLKLDPEDRNAILDMQDAVQDWGRYTLSRSRRDADLILVLQGARLARPVQHRQSPWSASLNQSHPNPRPLRRIARLKQ